MKYLWNLLASGFEHLSRLGLILAGVSLVLLLALVFHEVIARYILNSPTLYSVEISEYLLIFVAFLAAGWAMQEDRHVRMTSFIDLLPGRIRSILDVITSGIVFCFCIILVWQGAKSSLIAFKGGYYSSSLLEVPLWIPYAIIPAGSLLLALQILVRIGKTLTGRNENNL